MKNIIPGLIVLLLPVGVCAEEEVTLETMPDLERRADTSLEAWEPPRLVDGVWVTSGVSDQQAKLYAAEANAKKAEQEAVYQFYLSMRPSIISNANGKFWGIPGKGRYEKDPRNFYSLRRQFPAWMQRGIQPAMGSSLLSNLGWRYTTNDPQERLERAARNLKNELRWLQRDIDSIWPW